jgi:hypothetical protein
LVSSVVHVRQKVAQGRRVAQQAVGDHHARLTTRRIDHSLQEGFCGVVIVGG